MKVGFIGIGVMGLPMALSLVRSGTEVIAWNRTALRLETLKAAGAQIADNVDEVFKRAKVTILMLADGGAIDSVLGRKTDAFATCVKDHTIIHMGTTSPQYSKDLEADITLKHLSRVRASLLKTANWSACWRATTKR
jgi:3-hydroxyisobutyrate dehydrogenase